MLTKFRDNPKVCNSYKSKEKNTENIYITIYITIVYNYRPYVQFCSLIRYEDQIPISPMVMYYAVSRKYEKVLIFFALKTEIPNNFYE